MALYKGREKRCFKRRSAVIAVNIIRCGSKKTLPKLDEEVGANISEKGMLIECSKKLPKGTSITLKILLPHNSKFNIVTTSAKVMWSKQSFRGTYYFGCGFTRLQPKNRGVIKRYIK